MRPKQVRAARALLGWTQVNLARETGVGIAAIADSEREGRNPSFGAALGKSEKRLSALASSSPTASGQE